MINLLQENIKMESQRTNSVFAITYILYLIFKVFVNTSYFAQADTQTQNCKRAIFLLTLIADNKVNKYD